MPFLVKTGSESKWMEVNGSEISLVGKASNLEWRMVTSWLFQMRSEGFLFSFLGVWGWWTVLPVVFVSRGSNCNVATVYGESEKRWCVVTCESAFHVAGMGLCGTQAKVCFWMFLGSLIASSRCLRGSEKRWCVVTCESAFTWQAWDFVALKRKFVFGVSNRVVAVSMGKWEKVMCCDVWKCISRGRHGTLWHSSESLFLGSLIASSRCLWGVRKGDVLWRVKVHFAWQA